VGQEIESVPLEIKLPEQTDLEKQIWAKCRSRCSNCGQTERLRIKLIVPLEAGGQSIESNGVLLCRSCEMAAESLGRGGTDSEQRLVNFWVSRRLFDRLQYGLQMYNAFNSMGSLVRYLIAKYNEDEARFDDLELYQDEGADVKVNVWVERDRYNTFKVLLDKRGSTVTDTIKSLIAMYEQNSEILLAARNTKSEEHGS
jgi:hypothetical protein